MAIGVYFSPASLSGDRYDEIWRRLREAGAGSPPGRSYHCGFEVGGNIHVFDVWESQEQFEEFGKTLFPILQELGADPGQPDIAPVRHAVAG